MCVWVYVRVCVCVCVGAKAADQPTLLWPLLTAIYTPWTWPPVTAALRLKDGGPLYPAGSEDIVGGRAGPDADGLGQMEMFEDEGGGGI